jgi:hypothetical protein
MSAQTVVSMDCDPGLVRAAALPGLSVRDAATYENSGWHAKTRFGHLANSSHGLYATEISYLPDPAVSRW